MRFLARLVLNGVAIIVAAYFLPGLHVSGPFAALIAGTILGFVNAIVRPVLFFLTLPLTLLTLGLFIFVLNAICFELTAWLVPGKADMQRTTIDGALFVARTEDGGQSWQQLREGLPQENAYDVVYRHALGNSDETLAFGSTTGNLYISENRGDSWRVAANNLPPIYSVRFA